MIAAGVIKAISSPVSKYGATLPVDTDGKQTVTFIISNPEDISYYVKRAADNNEPVAGIFSFCPEDQFAHYLPNEKIQRV